ncbi:hypothetical protein MIR68_006184 [Amoeboaphelidium protococcarum]|nr:hypothetical protein MIR68_006184 [Amoeboaphelidium protococcarum]
MPMPSKIILELVEADKTIKYVVLPHLIDHLDFNHGPRLKICTCLCLRFLSFLIPLPSGRSLLSQARLASHHHHDPLQMRRSQIIGVVCKSSSSSQCHWCRSPHPQAPLAACHHHHPLYMAPQLDHRRHCKSFLRPPQSHVICIYSHLIGGAAVTSHRIQNIQKFHSKVAEAPRICSVVNSQELIESSGKSFPLHWQSELLCCCGSHHIHELSPLEFCVMISQSFQWYGQSPSSQHIQQELLLLHLLHLISLDNSESIGRISWLLLYYNINRKCCSVLEQ